MIDFDVKNVVDSMIQAWLTTASLDDLKAVFLKEEPNASVMEKIFQSASEQYQSVLLNAKAQLQSKYVSLNTESNQQEAEKDRQENEEGERRRQVIMEAILSLQPSIQAVRDEIARLDKNLVEERRACLIAGNRLQNVIFSLHQHNNLLESQESVRQLRREAARLSQKMPAQIAILIKADDELERMHLVKSNFVDSIKRKKCILTELEQTFATLLPPSDEMRACEERIRTLICELEGEETQKRSTEDDISRQCETIKEIKRICHEIDVDLQYHIELIEGKNRETRRMEATLKSIGFDFGQAESEHAQLQLGIQQANERIRVITEQMGQQSTQLRSCRQLNVYRIKIKQDANLTASRKYSPRLQYRVAIPLNCFKRQKNRSTKLRSL